MLLSCLLVCSLSDCEEEEEAMMDEWYKGALVGDSSGGNGVAKMDGEQSKIRPMERVIPRFRSHCFILFP